MTAHSANSRLSDYRNAIAGVIKEAMPGLKTCEALSSRFDLGELTRRGVRTPAVYVVLLRSPLRAGASDQLDAQVKLAIFAVASGPEERRENEVLIMGEAVAVLCSRRQMWGLTHIGPAEDLDIEQVHSDTLDKKGVSVVVVTFSQRVSKLGISLFTDEGKVPTQLYVNNELVDQADPPQGESDHG